MELCYIHLDQFQRVTYYIMSMRRDLPGTHLILKGEREYLFGGLFNFQCYSQKMMQCRLAGLQDGSYVRVGLFVAWEAGHVFG